MTARDKPPVAVAAMLIEKPAAEVFDAIVDPDKLTRFWFTRSSGPLAVGAKVRWEWEMYGAGADVEVQAVEPCRRILMTWGAPGAMTEVEWTFTPKGADATFVEVVNRGFAGDADAQTAAALDSTGGFALVLAGAKVWLEHGINAGLIEGRHPDALIPGWRERRGARP